MRCFTSCYLNKPQLPNLTLSTGLQLVADRLSTTAVSSIVVFGYNCGRFDQIIACIHSLFKGKFVMAVWKVACSLQKGFLSLLSSVSPRFLITLTLRSLLASDSQLKKSCPRRRFSSSTLRQYPSCFSPGSTKFASTTEYLGNHVASFLSVRVGVLIDLWSLDLNESLSVLLLKYLLVVIKNELWCYVQNC